jgi:hypothetical protein
MRLSQFDSLKHPSMLVGIRKPKLRMGEKDSRPQAKIGQKSGKWSGGIC